MSHIYVHIPFCHSKCAYCDFYSISSKKHEDEFIEALIQEFIIRKDEAHKQIETIYFGGGTPSILSEKKLEAIIETIKKQYNIIENPEITIEINPEDVEKEKMQFIKDLKFNRISIGIQSLYNKNLSYLGRKHNSQKSLNALNIINETGFDNISVDLIHGIPNSNIDEDTNQIAILKQNGVKHLSMYSLTIEKGTILEKRINKGLSGNIDNDFQTNSYLKMCEIAEKQGFYQYEISNFCMPSYKSKHNSAYWNGASYLGFGPAAHSYSNRIRKWNFANIENYIVAINKSKTFFELEDLSDNDFYNEFILTRLRTTSGIFINNMKKLFEKKTVDNIISEINEKNLNKYFNITKQNIALNSKGLLIADKITADMMKIE